MVGIAGMTGTLRTYGNKHIANKSLRESSHKFGIKIEKIVHAQIPQLPAARCWGFRGGCKLVYFCNLYCEPIPSILNNTRGEIMFDCLNTIRALSSG